MARIPPPRDLSTFTEPIWEQQTGEPQKNYLMFLQYASLRPSERTYTAGWRLWTADSRKEGKPLSKYYRDLAKHWCWSGRAAARDFYMMTTRQTRWIERDEERREDAYVVGKKLMSESKRALKKIDDLPDEEFKVSLTEAKDVAVAGAQLQAIAIPTVQLAADQIRFVMSSLPEDKRQAVLNRIQQMRQLSDQSELDEVVDAEYAEAK